jgi:hypothetical protein
MLSGDEGIKVDTIRGKRRLILFLVYALMWSFNSSLVDSLFFNSS